MVDIRNFLSKALPERLNPGNITNQRPPERGSGCIDPRTFFFVTGCIRHGCGCTEFLQGPSGGMAVNICCAKCGAKYNDTGMGIHSLHTMYDKIADMDSTELVAEQDHGLPSQIDEPSEETETESEPESEDLTKNPLLL